MRGETWTRFYLSGLIPVANVRSSPNLVRSAKFRAAIEGALWLPSSILPEGGSLGAGESQRGPRHPCGIEPKNRASAALMLPLARTGRIDKLSEGLCRSDDFPAIKVRMADFMATDIRRIGNKPAPLNGLTLCLASERENCRPKDCRNMGPVYLMANRRFLICRQAGIHSPGAG